MRERARDGVRREQLSVLLEFRRHTTTSVGVKAQFASCPMHGPAVHLSKCQSSRPTACARQRHVERYGIRTVVGARAEPSYRDAALTARRLERAADRASAHPADGGASGARVGLCARAVDNHACVWPAHVDARAVIRNSGAAQK